MEAYGFAQWFAGGTARYAHGTGAWFCAAGSDRKSERGLLVNKTRLRKKILEALQFGCAGERLKNCFYSPSQKTWHYRFWLALEVSNTC